MCRAPVAPLFLLTGKDGELVEETDGRQRTMRRSPGKRLTVDHKATAISYEPHWGVCAGSAWEKKDELHHTFLLLY